jgi:Lrp/AsnC family leucine-responsive transcriptional regulator
MNPTPGGRDHPRGGAGPAGLDDVDREIIDLLRQDARMTYTDLGQKTGLSVSAAHQRVRRLEERRIIIGYTAVLSHALLGLPYSAVIWVEDNGVPEAGQVERFRALAQIDTCHRVTGRYRYLLHAHVHDLAALEGLLEEIRAVARAPIIVDIVLDTAWENRPQPVGPASATRGGADATVPGSPRPTVRPEAGARADEPDPTSERPR